MAITEGTRFDPNRYHNAEEGLLPVGSVIRVNNGRDVYAIDYYKKLRYVNSPETLFTLGKTFDMVINLSPDEAKNYGFQVGQDPVSSMITAEDPLILSKPTVTGASLKDNKAKYLFIGIIVIGVVLVLYKFKNKLKS